MSLEILSRDVLLKAQEENKILAENLTKECSSIKEISQTRVEKFREKLTKQNILEINNFREKILGNYKSLGKTKVLNSKSELFEEVKKQSFSEIMSFSDSQKKDLFKSLIRKASDLIKIETIYTNFEDVKLVESLTKFKIIGDKKINGLLFENKDKTQILDMSFNSLLNEVLDKKSDEIQEVLYK